MKTKTKAYENILCVIPARAGSQGIIDKNLQLIGGIPLVEHSILHALDAGLDPKTIWVSSDSEEILDIALRNKVIADERPPGISGPTSSTEDTLLYVLNLHLKYTKSHNLKQCDHILLLQPTSPIRFTGTVKRFLDFYLNSDYDSALTTTKFYNFFWYFEIYPAPMRSTYDPLSRPMRQDLIRENYRFFENGSMYITQQEVLQDGGCRLGKNVGAFPISELEGMQIDTPEELEIFRAVFDGKISEKVGI